MSGTPETRHEREVTKRFSRWPGLTLVTLSAMLPWLAVLWTQLVSYFVVPWICAMGTTLPLHLVPALFLLLVAACFVQAFRDWRLVGGGFEDDRATVITRTRFASMVAMASAIFCALLILAMWLPMFIIHPCLRA